MSPSNWERVTELFHELVEKPPAEQERRLAELSTGEPELAGEVRSLLLADRRSDQIPDRAGPLPVDDLLAPGTAIGPYRVIAELARGGMGVVYRAERADGAFERQVAIKLTRPDLQSPALGDRFLAERRILAALDHPGIARLLDAGTTADGRLFLVLDLVDGEPLDRWAADRSLTARLELFLAICDAVEHAHRQLVLHRDLKPANILVTAAGEPKLLDFGIARLLGEDSAPGTATRLGLRPMTPEYASPEQLRGDPLATASDVYSLGIILFELLTGERPYAPRDSTSPEERARRIDTDPLPRPSSVLRRAPRPALFPARIVEGDLDAVVGRALAPELARRYASVAELAADLRRFLDGRPVEARNPGRIERARKFVRRHRNAVAAAGTVALVLIAATVFSLRQAAIAARERDHAERRFADVRELARVFVFELPDRIENLAGSTAARALLVKTGLSYLDRLYAEGGDDPGLTRELAAGYERLAEVQAGLNAANVGETAAALATLDRALELRQRLMAETAGDGVSEATELAAAHLTRATALFKNGRRAEALAEAQKTADLLAADSAPSGDPGRDRLFAKTLSLRGFLEATSGDLTAAEASLRSAVQRFDRLVARPPVAAAVRGERARALERLGSILGQNPGNYPEVERLWSEALAVDRALLAEAPRHPARTRAVMADLGRLAILRGVEGNFDAALLLSGEALVLAERLAAEDPDDFEAQRSLAQLRNRRSVDLTETGRLDEAERTARQGLASISALFAADPSNVTVETLVAEGHEAVGQVLVVRARAASDRAVWQAARGELAAAVEIIERLIARGVLAKDLGEAQEAETMRSWIAECDRFLAGSTNARNP